MPLTQLDATPALIVIDLQKGVIAVPTVHPIGDIISQRAAQLARAFRRRGLPVVLVNVTGHCSRPNRRRQISHHDHPGLRRAHSRVGAANCPDDLRCQQATRGRIHWQPPSTTSCARAA